MPIPATDDAFWMQRCLQLAAQALTLSNPNPRVGCVIVGPDGQVLGKGHTQAVGGPHAEVMALRDVQAQGHDPRGATAYVSLEPCSHHGRTPPCCDALVAAGIARVVAALPDPNPLVAGQGFARLRAAGVQVQWGVGAVEAAELNLGFLSRLMRQRPWVRLKVAASLDGITALPNGQSQWITGPAARLDGQAWRARACAILTGVGTVLHDDPLLNVRDIPATRQPHPAIVDSPLRTPPTARLFEVPQRQVLIYTACTDAARQHALQARGATVVAVPAAQGARVNLAAVMAHLAQWPVNELHVEAGATLNGALLAGDWVDEWLLYQAPTIIGGGLGMAQRPQPLETLAGVQPLQVLSHTAVGDDGRWLLRPTRRTDWLAPLFPAHGAAELPDTEPS